MERALNIATLPMGHWGAGFSAIEARVGHNVRGFFRREEDFQTFLNSRQYPRLFPGITFPENFVATNCIEETLQGADVVVFASPSRVLRGFYRETRQFIPEEAAIILLTKGIEQGSNQTMSQVLEDEEPGIGDRLSTISGPNFAEDAIRGLPMATALASTNHSLVGRLQADLSTPVFRIYAQDDVLGVELCATVKNIIAFAAGVGDGLEMGESGRAALVNRSLPEAMRFVTTLGGREKTVMGLAGVGDLVLTSTSDLSRNHNAGKELGAGLKTPKDLFDYKERTVESLYSVKAVVELAKQHGIDMPIAEAVYSVLYNGLSAKEVYAGLMARPLVHENRLRKYGN